MERRHRLIDTKVFVIGLTGVRLMPTSPAKARKLLKAGKAMIYQKRPFTIQLLYKTGSTVQAVSLGIDTGSQHIGISVISEEKAIYRAEVQLRSTMEKRSLLETRREYRRGRRYRKTRYRRPKFRHHTKRTYSEKLVTRKSTKHKTHWVKETASYDSNRPKGWLPPSIESKLQVHYQWIDRFLDVLPSNAELSIELARFDVARMKDPTVHGELYQKGPQYDYENTKAYVFDRDHYRCKCCGAKAGNIREDGTTVKLIVHHIDLRAEGATDNPERLATVCDACHSPRNHKPGGILYDWFVQEKKFRRGYRDTAFMNILQRRMYAQYPNARFTYGNITAADRKRLQLEKSHANDAVAIAAHEMETVELDCSVTLFKQVRKKKRSLHEANPRKGRSAPNRDAIRASKNTKQARGFFLWDKVRTADSQVGWICGFACGGSAAYVQNIHGQYIKQPGKSYLTHQLSTLSAITHNNGWITCLEDQQQRRNF